MAFDIGNYVGVDQRIAQFRAKHPEGSLRPLDPAKPFEVLTIGGATFLVVVAAAYRSPDDTCPGVGMAYEPFPGKTSYTKDSELQNAETSAWGRAIVATLAADTKGGIASSEDIRNRRADEDIDPATGSVRTTATRPGPARPAPTPSPTAGQPDDPFRPFEEADQTMAGTTWVQNFRKGMADAGFGDPKTQSAVIAYAVGGVHRDPKRVLKSQVDAVRATFRALVDGKLAEEVSDKGVVTLVEVPAEVGAA